MTDEQAAHQRRKGRSPSYPAVDLDDAIRRVEQIYGSEGQHPTPLPAVLKHWNYRSLNGPAGLTLSACRKFELVDVEGRGDGREIRVSDLAVNILQNPNEAQRRAAIDVAALAPAAHRDLWDKYGATLPSDATVTWYLKRERGFTATGADEFVKEYRATLAYAHQFGAGSLGAQEAATNGDEEDLEEVAPPPPRRRRLSATVEAETYVIPIAAGRNVAVEGPFPLTEEQWRQFQSVLAAMKPALVAGEDGESSSTDDLD